MSTTRLLVDLDRLENNYSLLRGVHAQNSIMTVVKANAYGHGLLPVSRFLQSLGQELFGVARIEEALALRQGGIQGRIMVLGPPAPDSMGLYAPHGIEMTIPSVPHLRQLLTTLPESCPAIHLKLDTGMGRVGFPEADKELLPELLAQAPWLRIAGIGSHLAESERLDSDYSHLQLERFTAWLDILSQVPAARTAQRHLANSAALLRGEEFHFDFARVGYALWAPVDFTPPEKAPRANASLRPVTTLTAPVSFIKKARRGDSVGYARTYSCREGEMVATVPVGYGDGYLRSNSNRAQAALDGRRFPVVGNVSMDQTTISLGDQQASLGQEAILFGGEGSGPSLREVADWMGTIGYEVLTGISARVSRVYLRDGREIAPP
ncbi:MAG: alanine racemase [Deltaproteobacteria bacterium]|nr:alanine racemase [Deltaproteobacteria bacterium]